MLYMDLPDNQELLKTLLKEQLNAELDLLSQRVKAEQELLYQQVQAEQNTANELKRKNDLEEQALKNLERSRQAEFQRTQLWLNISEQTANLVQQLPEMSLSLYGYFEKFDEFTEDITERLNRIDYGLMLLLSGVKGHMVNHLVEELENEHRQRLENERRQKLLEQHKTMLHNLKMKQATFGKLSAPPHLQIEIEELQEEIDKLERE